MLSPVGRKTSLDWAHLKDLEENHKVFHELAAWLARCAADKRAYKLKDFRELRAAESSASRIRDGGTPTNG